jgi:hypothetical protein
MGGAVKGWRDKSETNGAIATVTKVYQVPFDRPITQAINPNPDCTDATDAGVRS